MHATKRILVAVALAASLPGCTGLATDCGPDWQEIGLRDGRLGAEPQAAVYAARCNTQVDEQRYRDGWQAGMALRPRIAAF